MTYGKILLLKYRSFYIVRNTNYLRALNYLSQFNTRTMNRTNGLHHQIMQELLDLFSIRPHDFKLVQITGSCGKGSTAHFISSILSYHSYRHGLFTGPHLNRYEERFMCNGEMIEQDEFSAIVLEVEKKLSGYHYEQEVGHMHVMIVIALLFFQRKGIDLIIFENGVGGKADPSNIFDPIIAVLTEITLDHSHLLGSTIEEIIIDKSCIIKDSTKYVICGMNNVQARNYLLKIEAHDPAAFLFFNRDYVNLIKQADETGSTFHFKSEHLLLENIDLSLIGTHQVQNASNALAVIEAFIRLGYEFNEYMIHSALKSVHIPCRMEILEKNGVKFLFDGAHNILEMKTLKKNIDLLGLPISTVILSISSNKDIARMLQAIEITDATYIITPHPFLERNISRREIEEAFQTFETNNYMYNPNLEDTIKSIYENTKGNTFILVTGSLYLVGYVKSIFFPD